MRRRLLAIFLTLTMALAVFPASALATEDEAPDSGMPVACTMDDTCEAETHNEDCPRYVAPEADNTLEDEELTSDEEEPSEAEKLQARINALPTVEELSAMEDEERDAVIQEAYQIDDALTEELRKQLDTAKLDAIFDWLNVQTATQPDDTTEPVGEEGTENNPWDISAEGEENNVTAYLTLNEGSETYTLIISGSGAMKDFGTNDAPWKTALKNIEGGTYADKTTNGDSGEPKTFYKISEVVIETGVTSIGNNAFSYTDVSEITIPDSVTMIGSGVFTWTLQLKEIHIPSSVTNLNYTTDSDGEYTYYNTFDGAFHLETILVDANSENYVTTGGILIGKVPGTSNDWMIINCPDQLNRTQISAGMFGGYNITAVGQTAFSACANLTIIDLPDTITDIGAGAFNKCYSLTSFTVPDGVTEFGGNFRGCSSLQFVDWNNVTSITASNVFAPFWEDENGGAEHVCAVATTDLSKVTNIADGAFRDSQLESVTFSDSHDLYIGAQAFADCENWEMYELDFSYGKYVAFNAFDGTDAYNIIFPTTQSDNAVVELVRGQRTFYLESFDEAIRATQTGDVIRLLDDAELSSTTTVPNNVEITLDLGGHVLKFTGGNGRLFTVYGTLNIQDSAPTIKHTYKVRENGLWVLDEAGQNTLQGGVITGGNHEQLNGGAIMVTSGGTLNISGGNIVGNQAAGASGGVAVSGTGSTANITGGSVRGNISTSGGAHIADLAGSGYSISGGTFTTPLQLDWCSGILQPHDNGDGTYTVSYEGQGAARIGNTYYKTFNEAFNAAKEMETATIVVMADTKLTGVCQLNADSAAKITVDLNGHVLTAADNNRLFTVQGGTLNIQDSNPDAVHYYTKAESGLWTLCKGGEEGATAIYGGVITGGCFGNNGGAIVVTSGATVNMYGGNIIGNTSKQSAAASGGVNVSQGIFNMYGGTIQGNIYDFSGTGVRDINGGTIYGGTFTTDVDSWVAAGYSAKETSEGSGVYVVTKSVENYTIATIPDQVYTGEEIKPNVIVMNSEGALDSTKYSVTYSNNTNVGEAKARVAITDNPQQAFDVTFRIIRDESPTVEMADANITYGGTYNMIASAKTAAGNAITKNDAITIEYYTDPGCAGSSLPIPPTGAGVYYVKATLTETENYAETFTVATLTIMRADFSVSAKGYEDTYDGQPHSISVTAEEDVTVSYSRNGYTYTAENPTFTDAGSYTVYYRAEKPNHNDVTGYLTVNINKAPLTATYSGEVIRFGQTPTLTVTVDGFVNDETVETAAGYLTPVISNAPTDVGQYTLTPEGGTANNYTFHYISGTLVILSNSSSRPSGGSTTPSYPVSTVGTDHGEIDVNPSRAEEGEEVTITATPDEGYAVDEVIVTDRDGDPVDVTDEGDGVYTFEMPNSRVTIEVTFSPVAEEPKTPAAPTGWVNPYGDVAANAWYYDAVAYVSANGLMTGTSPTAFSPDSTTSRAMIWTVLARMNGQSVDGGSPWYAMAQSWAMRANVSDGTDPNGSITREQLAAMLYRAAGSPAVTGNLLAYPDGGTVSAWAESAMLWATQNGIISGINGALTPQGLATRAQVAVMLQRFCGVV